MDGWMDGWMDGRGETGREAYVRGADAVGDDVVEVAGQRVGGEGVAFGGDEALGELCASLVS